MKQKHSSKEIETKKIKTKTYGINHRAKSTPFHRHAPSSTIRARTPHRKNASLIDSEQRLFVAPSQEYSSMASAVVAAVECRKTMQ
jgi:hypothetical protein